MGAVEFSPPMNQFTRALRRKHIYISLKRKVLLIESSWKQGLSVEWHGKRRFGNRISHPVSITFGRREGCLTVEVYDQVDEVTIASLQSG
jgi:hypothetical protein